MATTAIAGVMLLLAVLGAMGAPTTDGSGTTSLPNIIFILADDLGYGDVQYNGGVAHTPNLNAMAAEDHSISLSRFYSGAPVCTPTRGTVLTGRNHNRYCMWGVNGLTNSPDCTGRGDFNCPSKAALPASETTVAEILKDSGYRTAVFGKWHVGDLKSLPESNPTSTIAHPGLHGFDVWKVTEQSVPTTTPNCACIDSSQCYLGHYNAPLSYCTNYHSPNETDPNSLVSHSELIRGDDSHFIVNEFEDYLKDTITANSEQPFFTYISFHAPHTPYIALPKYTNRYSSYTQEEVDYYGTITAMDEAVGRIRELLSLYNVSDNTMIWFGSDNGPAETSPGTTGGLRGSKGELYEGGIRVPGIIAWPAVIQGNRNSDFPVITSDFLPTVCDIVGATPPNDREIDGISILPLLKGETSQRSGSISWTYNNSGNFNGQFTAAIQSDNNKAFVEYRGGSVSSSALYNLTSDPEEQFDLSSQYPDILSSMVAELDTKIQSFLMSAESEVGCL